MWLRDAALGSPQRLELRVLGVDRHRQEADPELAQADLAVAERRQMVAEMFGGGADGLFGRVERQAADEQHVAAVVLDHCVSPSRIATTRAGAALARWTFRGKHATVNPVEGSTARLVSRSICEYGRPH